LRIIGAAQSDRNLISAEESYLGIDSPPSAHLRLRPCALRRCINDKDTPKFRAGIAIERAAWSDEDFVKALHEGVGRDGKHLYPAFPYTSYTLMTRSDVLAVKGHDLRAVDLLLQAGAALCLRTRIDNCETPREMAEKAGLREIAEMLAVREARLGS
jgi:hypothetical protein